MEAGVANYEDVRVELNQVCIQNRQDQQGRAPFKEDGIA